VSFIILENFLNIVVEVCEESIEETREFQSYLGETRGRVISQRFSARRPNDPEVLVNTAFYLSKIFETMECATSGTARKIKKPRDFAWL
jgi:hypothetical protein